MKRSAFMLMALVAAILSFNGFVSAGDDVPAKVSAAFKKLAGDADVEIEGKERDGKTFYEGEWEEDDREHEAIVDAGGKVLMEESEVGENSVPEVVRTAAKKHLGADAKIEYDKIVRHEEDGDVTIYDAEGVGKKVTLNAKGELVDDEDDDEDDDDDDDENEDDDD